MSNKDLKCQYIQRKGHEDIDLFINFVSEDNKLLFCEPSRLQDNQSFSMFSYTALKIKLLTWLKDIFLPQGYPYSVSTDYLQYQIWDSLQAYCSNLAGALSLHSTLIGIGVGKDSATPLAAAISWLTKDGAGMISSITFAYYKGCELDYNSKQWRLFADIANDGAHFIRLLAPVLPFPFLFIFCCSSVMSSLVGVAGGATRASLIQHQAQCNNMADVSAKDGSQETLVNLAGLITSLTLLPLLTSDPIITWMTFVLFVCLHLYTNFKAMRSIQMTTLNRPRILHIFDIFVHSSAVPDVISTNQNEPLFVGPAFINNYLTKFFKLEGGVSLGYAFEKFKNKNEFQELFHIQHEAFEDIKYMVFPNMNSRIIYIIYHKDAQNIDIVESFWTAYLFAINKQEENKGISKAFIIDAKSRTTDAIRKVKDLSKSSYVAFISQLFEKGWKADPLRLNIGEYRLMSKKYS